MEVQKDAEGNIKRRVNAQQQIKPAHKCGKNGHFARACLGKSYKHRVQSIQAKQEIDMAEYEENPTTRYQASQIKVCAKVNQVKEPQEPRTSSGQKDSDGHNPVRKKIQTKKQRTV